MNKKTETIEILSQSAADSLLCIDKRVDTANDYIFPHEKKRKLCIPLKSIDNKHSFNLDIFRGNISLSKITYQTRYSMNTILARLDLNSKGHRNPDGVLIEGCHIHTYKEGYGDRFAIALPPEFANVDKTDMKQMLNIFMAYCHIIEPPKFRYKEFTDSIVC